MSDSKLWEEAYKKYKSSYGGYSRNNWGSKVRSLAGQNTKIKVKGYIPRPSVKEVSIEFHRWKKTDGFRKWSHKQFLKQGGTCFYCDIPLKGIRQNVDHIVPRSRGGTNAKRNLVLACWRCNEKKKANMIPLKDLAEHRIRNNKKKGTYHTIQYEYQSDVEFAYELRQRLRED